MKLEFLRCSKDPVYFMRKYCYIQHAQKGKIKFDLYPFQEKTLQALADDRFNIILKSRQLGISTLTAGYSLWAMTFQSDFNVLVIATKQDVAKNLVTKVHVMYNNLPAFLKRDWEEKNKLGLRFKNGSQIKAVSASDDAGRSEALSLLVIDEAAFIQNIEEIWTSAFSTLSTGGRSIVLSTPNGVGNWFHGMWVGAENGDNDFKTIKLHWTVHPDRDQTWRDEQTKQLGKRRSAQECDCDFISSGHTVIEGEILQKYMDTTSDPLEYRGLSQDLWVWKPVDYSRDYMVVADVSRGDASDYSTFHVMDVETIEQVAEFRAKVKPDDFGRILVSIATEYNNALLVVENANLGYMVLQRIIDMGYQNVYYSYKNDPYVDPEVHLMKAYDLKNKSDMTPGFTLSHVNRPLVVGKLEYYMMQEYCKINSKRLVNELMTFIWLNDRPQAARGYHDDLVMAFAMGLWVRDTAIRLRNDGMDLNKRALQYMASGNRKMKGAYTSRNRMSSYQAGWEMDTAHGRTDLSWLIGNNRKKT